MNFDELCEDFSKRKPATEVGSVPYISVEWKSKYASSNDLLRTYLNSNRIPYLNDFNGTVWFLYDGEWTRTKVKYDRESNMAHFNRCIFEYDKGKAAEKKMRKLWGRVGMEFMLEEETYQMLLQENGNSKTAESAIVHALRSGKAVVNGETYFPGQNMMGNKRYDNPEDDIEFFITDEEALKDLEYPILKRPFNRTELMRNLSSENRILGVVQVELSEIIGYDLEHFLDLLEERLGVDGFLVSGTTYKSVGHSDNTVFLLVEATSEDTRLKYDPNPEEFDHLEFEETFFFKSRQNGLGIVYHAKRDGLDYLVSWDSGSGKRAETRYTKTEMIRMLKNGSFAVCDESGKSTYSF